MTEHRRRRHEYSAHPKVLIVEGATEEFLIPELMEANGVAWDNDWRKAPVQIRDMNGTSNILKKSFIDMQAVETHRRATGILLDADNDFESRWMAIRDLCLPTFPLLDSKLPESGAITSNESGQRLGIWIMPDNGSPGMMEDFLAFLVPGGKSDPVYAYAEECCSSARAKGATFKDDHLAKARIYTWLAWQDEPGRQLHDAVKFRLFDPMSASAQPFVKWFREVFEV